MPKPLEPVWLLLVTMAAGCAPQKHGADGGEVSDAAPEVDSGLIDAGTPSIEDAGGPRYPCPPGSTLYDCSLLYPL
jgi:hypothetical protein